MKYTGKPETALDSRAEMYPSLSLSTSEKGGGYAGSAACSGRTLKLVANAGSRRKIGFVFIASPYSIDRAPNRIRAQHPWIERERDESGQRYASAVGVAKRLRS